MPVPARPDVSARRDWYVVGVRPGQEARAEWHLRLQGFDPYLPRQRRTVRHARRMVSKLSPFFPGYMFLPVDLDRARWRSINGTFGVSALIMQGERPAICPPGLVETMIGMTDADGTLDLTSTFKAGQSVRIVQGPMAELFGKLEAMDRAGRARVLVEIMNRKIVLTLGVHDLIAAD
jgi:transcription elongation factor/antiterminator RfaH